MKIIRLQYIGQSSNIGRGIMDVPYSVNCRERGVGNAIASF